MRTAVVTAHRSLKKEDKRIHRLFPQMGQTQQQRGGGLNHYKGDTHKRQGGTHYNNQSQAEITLSRYSGGDNAGLPTNSNTSTRQGTNDHMFPFNPDNPS